MKKILNVFLIVIIVLLCLSGCSQSKQEETELSGNDLIAYNLMLEVCKVAKDPSDTFVLGGTVTDGDSGGALKVKSGSQISYVIITYENGKAVCSDGEEAANYSNEYKEMFTKTSDFNISKVNSALKSYWGVE